MPVGGQYGEVIMKTKLIIVRHGESIGNKTKYLLGHTDLDMSELGYAQAAATADYLSGERIDAVYSSDLLRAVNTALPHARLRGLEVKLDEGLREVGLGDWEGRHISYVLEKYGEMYDRYKTRDFGVFTYPKGGENVREAGARFGRALIKIAEENEGKTVLVATHAAVLRSFYASLLRIAPERVAEELPFPTNASCTYIDYENGELIPVEYSHDSHLEAVGITKVTT